VARGTSICVKNDHELKTEVELERLQSMRERVARLRSQLKYLEQDTYSAAGTTEQERQDAASLADGVSQEIHAR